MQLIQNDSLEQQPPTSQEIWKVCSISHYRKRKICDDSFCDIFILFCVWYIYAYLSLTKQEGPNICCDAKKW